MNHPTGFSRRRGLVLLFVLGALALLSVLGVALVSYATLERNISRTYIDRTRAILAAESGLEAAVARLKTLAPADLSWMTYNPDDPNAPLSKATQPSFALARVSPTTGRPVSGVIGDTYSPGGDYYLLKVRDESGKLNLNDSNREMADGTLRLDELIVNLLSVITGDETTGAGLAAVLLQAREDAGGLWSSLDQVGETLLQAGMAPALVASVLNNCTLWSWQDPEVIHPNPAFGSLEDAMALYGNALINTFPKYGFPFMRWEEAQSFEDPTLLGLGGQPFKRGYELDPRSPININEATPEMIEALLRGVSGWTLFEGPAEKNQGEISKSNFHPAFGVRSGPVSNYLYENGKTRDSAWFASCANRPFLDHNTPTSFLYATLPYARMRFTVMEDDMAEWLAQDLYDRIHEDGKPLRSWREMESYLNEVVARAPSDPENGYAPIDELAVNECLGVPGWTDPFRSYETATTWTYDRTDEFRYFNKYYRDLLLANFDPNTLSNDFNPDQACFRYTDKADLVHYSTELCFEPTGKFSIECEGYVVEGPDKEAIKSGSTVADPYGTVHAKVGVEAVVQVFEMKRLSSQQALVGKVTDKYERFGNANDTSTLQTKLDTTTCSLPEPWVADMIDDTGAANPWYFCETNPYDGRIALAPLKHTYANGLLSAYGGPTLKSFFEGTLDAVATGNVTVSPDQYTGSGGVEEEVLLADRLMQGTGVAVKPGSLHADGAFSEAWKCLAYPSKVGATQLLGDRTVANDYTPPDPPDPEPPFWIPPAPPAWATGNFHYYEFAAILTFKPNFSVEDSNRTRNFFVVGGGVPNTPPNGSAAGWQGTSWLGHLPAEISFSRKRYTQHPGYGNNYHTSFNPPYGNTMLCWTGIPAPHQFMLHMPYTSAFITGTGLSFWNETTHPVFDEGGVSTRRANFKYTGEYNNRNWKNWPSQNPKLSSTDSVTNWYWPNMAWTDASGVENFGYTRVPSSGYFTPASSHQANEPVYHVEGRRWNMAYLGAQIKWEPHVGNNFNPFTYWHSISHTNPEPFVFQMHLNGQKVASQQSGAPTGTGLNSTDYAGSDHFHYYPWAARNSFMDPIPQAPALSAPIRFGAFARCKSSYANNAQVYDPADSTFGEFFIYKRRWPDTTNFNNNTSGVNNSMWMKGFYYNDPAPAVYTTPEIDLGASLTMKKHEVNGKPVLTFTSSPVIIRSIAWTDRWPDFVIGKDIVPEAKDPAWDHYDTAGEYAAAKPGWMTGADDPKSWDPFTVDLRFVDDTRTKQWLYDDAHNMTPPVTGLADSGGSQPTMPGAGERVRTYGPIQLRFYFNLKSYGQHPEPLRESPALDDITITYITEEFPKVLYYRMK